jgi:hypothetical protein
MTSLHRFAEVTGYAMDYSTLESSGKFRNQETENLRKPSFLPSEQRKKKECRDTLFLLWLQKLKVTLY